uniref:Uncharacterized protein n=1 Tax=Cacopsylla melanoneura TaxID=428564 RepID=A0A8D8W6W9_9HEMI
MGRINWKNCSLQLATISTFDTMLLNQHLQQSAVTSRWYNIVCKQIPPIFLFPSARGLSMRIFLYENTGRIPPSESSTPTANSKMSFINPPPTTDALSTICTAHGV